MCESRVRGVFFSLSPSYPLCLASLQAEEFDALDEDDQYTYLEELAPRMTMM